MFPLRSTRASGCFRRQPICGTPQSSTCLSSSPFTVAVVAIDNIVSPVFRSQEQSYCITTINQNQIKAYSGPEFADLVYLGYYRVPAVLVTPSSTEQLTCLIIHNSVRGILLEPGNVVPCRTGVGSQLTSPSEGDRITQRIPPIRQHYADCQITRCEVGGLIHLNVLFYG